MKRSERNEFNYIRRSLKGFTLGYGTTLTIRTDGSHEYKQARIPPRQRESRQPDVRREGADHLHLRPDLRPAR